LPEYRVKILFSCLEFFREKSFPYVTSQTFYCYINKDSSVTCCLGSARDMVLLKEYLEEKYLRTFAQIEVQKVSVGGNSVVDRDAEIASKVYRKDTTNFRAIAMREGDAWYIAHTQGFNMEEKVNIFEDLRKYYNISCQEGFDTIVNNLKEDELLKLTRVAECPQSKRAICITPQGKTKEDFKFISHKAYRQAVRSEKLKYHKTYGIYNLGPYDSPFFSSYPVRVIPPSRYGLGVSQVIFYKEGEDPEEFLLKKIVGKIWMFSIYDKVSS